MRDICRFTCIRPVPGRLEGVFFCALPGYEIDTCIFETSRTGYGMGTRRFTRIRPASGRLVGVFDTPPHGYMKNLCRSAGNVFTSRKSPGPFASKESGLGFLLCERTYPPYVSQNDSGNHVFIRYVSKKIPCRLAEPVFSGGYASRKSSCLRSRLACSTVMVIGSPKR